jgi:hypothetical protein
VIVFVLRIDEDGGGGDMSTISSFFRALLMFLVVNCLGTVPRETSAKGLGMGGRFQVTLARSSRKAVTALTGQSAVSRRSSTLYER